MGRALIKSDYCFIPDRLDDKLWDVVAITLAGKLRFDRRCVDRDDYSISRCVRSFRFVRARRTYEAAPQVIRLTLLRMDPVKWILGGQTSKCSLVNQCLLSESLAVQLLV